MSQTPEQSSAPKQRRTRFGCLLSILCTLAIVVLTTGLSYFAWYSHARGQLDTAMAKIRDRGEPLWFHELAPKDTDPDENGATLYLQALAKIQPPSPAVASAVVANLQKPPSEDPLIIAELARNREILDLIGEAVRKPSFHLPIDYNTTRPFSITGEPWQSARDLARLFEGDVAAALAVGDHDRAIETIERMFDLSELLKEEPNTITQLIRIAISSMAQASLKQTMAQVDLTPQQFASLDNRLARMVSTFTLVPAMLGERAASFTTIYYLDENLDIVNEQYPQNAGYEPLQSVRLSSPLRPMMMADQAHILQIMSDVIEVIDKTGREGADAMQEIEVRIQNMPKSHVLTRLLLPALVNVYNVGLRHREKLLTARLGIRVDRYYAVHHRFPASLDEVADDSLRPIPVDHFAGKPHVYRVLPDGFVIYSTGPNGIDEGGGKSPDQIELFTNFDVHYPELAADSGEELK
jgi:hypothetical protein